MMDFPYGQRVPSVQTENWSHRKFFVVTAVEDLFIMEPICQRMHFKNSGVEEKEIIGLSIPGNVSNLPPEKNGTLRWKLNEAFSQKI